MEVCISHLGRCKSRDMFYWQRLSVQVQFVWTGSECMQSNQQRTEFRFQALEGPIVTHLIR